MKIPYFKKGSLITIQVVENLYKGSKNHQQEPQHTQQLYQQLQLQLEKMVQELEKEITGICIKKKNKGRDSYVELKYVINNESIRQKFPLYSPFVIVSKPPEESKQRNKQRT